MFDYFVNFGHTKKEKKNPDQLVEKEGEVPLILPMIPFMRYTLENVDSDSSFVPGYT